MSIPNLRFLTLALLVSVISTDFSRADIVAGGSATVEFNSASLLATTGLTPVWFYDANNGAKTATQADILTPFAGGGSALPVSAVHILNHEIFVGAVVNPAGRARQATLIDIDLASPGSSWSSVEQIGIDGITAFTVASGGGLVAGDFSVVYSSLNNRLSLFNNFQLPVEAFRVNNPTFTQTVSGFTVQGALLTGDFFSLGFGIPADQSVGSFSLNAITAVPEPTSMALIACGITGLGYRRIRKSRVCVKPESNA